MILPGAAKLSASGPSAVTSGQPFTVSATLKTSDGRPLSGKTVEVGGSSGKTDSRGEVTIQAKAEASFGIGQVKVPVRYLGDADWGESTTSIAVTIAPADH